MSIRTNSMKAVPLVLNHLNQVRRTHSIGENRKVLDDIESRLNQIKGLFHTVKEKGEELLDWITELDGLLRNFNPEEMKSYGEIVKRITKSAENLQPGYSASTSVQQKTVEKDPETVHQGLSLSQPPNNELVDQVLKNIQVSYDNLDLQSKLCCLSLSVFPENAVIKKRPLIYWWIGEGFLKKKEEKKTAEEVGEAIFDELLNSHLITPYGNGKCPIVNKCQIHPWIRHMLVSMSRKVHLFRFYSQEISGRAPDSTSSACLLLDQKNVNMGDNRLKPEDLRTIFNVDASYLSFGTNQCFDKMKRLLVLQLGRWQGSPLHHIEVDRAEFLNNLATQKHLRYLSMRGISRISKLPPSIARLGSLEILDLKACHNLEALPADIALLSRSLTHLDVSQCYLLESMPKGLEKLTKLQALKGFVIGSSRKTPCRVGDLAKLKELRRLSIHIGSEAECNDVKELERLKELNSVQRLKISWGVTSAKTNNKTTKSGSASTMCPFSLPPNLEKLDLEGFPEDNIPEWLKPSNVPTGLKKLYIKGGKLKSLDHGQDGGAWRVEILRLKYLKNLKIKPEQLISRFPRLRYVKVQQVANFDSPRLEAVFESEEDKRIWVHGSPKPPVPEPGPHRPVIKLTKQLIKKAKQFIKPVKQLFKKSDRSSNR